MAGERSAPNRHRSGNPLPGAVVSFVGFPKRDRASRNETAGNHLSGGA
jgi:hypothetical protein